VKVPNCDGTKLVSRSWIFCPRENIVSAGSRGTNKFNEMKWIIAVERLLRDFVLNSELIWGAMTLSIMTFSIRTVSIWTVSIMKISIITVSIMTVSILTDSITTVIVMASAQ
jgi:hypothetical protein